MWALEVEEPSSLTPMVTRCPSPKGSGYRKSFQSTRDPRLLTRMRLGKFFHRVSGRLCKEEVLIQLESLPSLQAACAREWFYMTGKTGKSGLVLTWTRELAKRSW